MAMTLPNRNMSSVQKHYEINENSTNDKFNNTISQVSNEGKRFRRDDYDDEEYEVVCKHSNTGMSLNILGAYYDANEFYKIDYKII
jgi:hypothetical protein